MDPPQSASATTSWSSPVADVSAKKRERDEFNDERDDDDDFRWDSPPSTPPSLEAGLSNLSLSPSSSSSPTTRRLSTLSIGSSTTPPTSPSSSARRSHASELDSEDSEEEDDGEVLGLELDVSSVNLMARSAPVSALAIPKSSAGRKRSLTDILVGGKGEEERSRLRGELASWINASPSPFESNPSLTSPSAPDLSRAPFPRFPLFTVNAASPSSSPKPLQLDERGLPIASRNSLLREKDEPKKRSYGFIPASAVVGGVIKSEIGVAKAGGEGERA
ncbi:hypothetical protein MNV49_000779 [Pseudohyphozyma bogoriensis]|nr:hypothetical protein MNV49_000779 [Pseudohyphozyma bogoriensis]